MHIFVHLLSIISLTISTAWALGCMSSICKGNEKNVIAECSAGFCGDFKSKRRDGQLFEGVDLECTPGTDVFAPFDGVLYFWRPFGNHVEYHCADEGVRIEGIGQWQGYHVLMASVSLDFYGGRVRKGDRIGIAKDHRCIYADDDSEPFIRLQLFHRGKPVDPTYHLRQCMCTGQICETNPKNELLGEPFKHDSRYNGVRGWDIKCPKFNENEEESRSPDIYAPIDAEVIGRKRLYSTQGVYRGCDNNGVVLVGTDSWTDYEVVLYNVHFREALLGRQHVVQGEPIATRLNCKDSPDSVFIEVRYQGVVVNITDMLLARSCRVPEFSPK